jgi:tetratricopeptide (TPR) repeat protein
VSATLVLFPVFKKLNTAVMKKNTLYTIVLVLFIAAIGFIIFKYNNDEKSQAAAIYALQERKAIAQPEEWESTRKRADALLNAVKTNPADTKSLNALAGLFIQEARVTGNYVYYDMAAMKYINDVLKTDSTNFDALTLKSLIYLSQHHFADGLTAAQKAQSINPYNAFVYGILVDGNVEMGNYDSAITKADKMVSIRPDIRSYSRISYLREIYGDYPGAIEAMKLAVQAGIPGDETTEWARVQLGHLYENSGDLRNAEMYYTLALNARPSYAYAIAGMARIAMAAKDYSKAIALYGKADSLVNDYSFKEELVDAYKLSGDNDKAMAIANMVIEGMSKDAQQGQNNDNIGHYADRELAYAYLKVNNNDKALEHALAEYNRRPDNIDVNETLAWVYYCKGDFAKALPYAAVALKTGSKNPTLLCRTGLIYSRTGDKVQAKKLLQQALMNNANIAVNLKADGINTLQTL